MEIKISIIGIAYYKIKLLIFKKVEQNDEQPMCVRTLYPIHLESCVTYVR